MAFLILEKVFTKNSNYLHYKFKIMKRIIFIQLIIILSSCKQKDVALDHEKMITDFSIFQEIVLPDYLQNRFDPEQLGAYLNELKITHAGLFSDSDDSIEYLIVPAINIPIHRLDDYSGNLLDFLKYGEMAINNSELLIFELDSLRLKFLVKDGLGELRDGFSELDFNLYPYKIPKKIFQESDAYFSLRLTQNTGVFPIPGIFLNRDKQLKIITPEGNIIEVEELYQTLFENREDFDQYIRNIVTYSKKFKQ